MNIIINKQTYFTIILVLLVIVFFVLYVEKSIYNNQIIYDYELYKQNNEIMRYDQNKEIVRLINLNKDLNKQLLELSAVLTRLNYNYEQLGLDYNVQKNEINNTIDMIRTYKYEIESSMGWFRQNSNINNYSLLKRTLISDCVNIDKNNCFIKSGCIYLVNDKQFNLKYKLDTKTSGVEDKLQSIDTFWKNKGGDCEDYSLFYKAELNAIINYCDGKNKEIVFDVWSDKVFSPNTNNKYNKKYFLDNARNWYLPDVYSYSFSDYKYPAIVCGNMPDPNNKINVVSGHCAIALSKYPLYDLDINVLNEAILIEPQDGRFLGHINTTSNIFIINNVDDFEKYESYIYQIIVDEDHYLFSTTFNKWLSYGVFDNIFTNQLYLLNNFIK